jgi:predicted small integral membrane protein
MGCSCILLIIAIFFLVSGVAYLIGSFTKDATLFRPAIFCLIVFAAIALLLWKKGDELDKC